jgi:hypothetical protein
MVEAGPNSDVRFSPRSRFRGINAATTMHAPQGLLGSEPLYKLRDFSRLRHMLDLERSYEDSAVAEQASDGRLLELDGVDRAQAHRLCASPQRALGQIDALGGDDEARPFPAPHGPQGDCRTCSDRERTEQRQRPKLTKQDPAGSGEPNRLR